MAKTTPIPQNKIEESFVWREWFQKISDRVFGTAATLDVPILPVYGGTGITTYNTGDMLYSDSTNHLNRIPAPASSSFLTMSSGGVPTWKNPKYGMFFDTTHQTAAANTPTAITFNTTSLSNGVSLGSPASRIVISQAGVYNIQFSIQFTNTAAATDDAAVWFRINGTNLTNSNSWVSVHSKHGSINGNLLLALNLFYNFAANDYFELIWMTVGGTSSLDTLPSSSTPLYPAAPSVIVTVNNNISA